MKLHELRSPAGSRKQRTRVGRGISAGQGKTSGRGQKGQGSRSGNGIPRHFEGGQRPITQRIPELRGFNNKWRKEYSIVNVGKLSRFDKNAIVDPAALAGLGLVPRSDSAIKVLGDGKLKIAVVLRVHRVSAAAQKAIERAGGRVELLEQVATQSAEEGPKGESSPVEG